MTIRTFFQETFGKEPDQTVFVPGRVNLIGEHIDYNGGRVLPCALNRGVNVALSLRADKDVVVASDRFEGTSRSVLGGPPAESWARYAVSTLQLANDIKWLDCGADVGIVSDLSDGAGLSSSAALCVAILKALRAVCGATVTDVEIAQLARRVENDYIGMPCGIMDQMAVAVAKPGEALFLDTATLDYEPIALPEDVLFVVLHSGIHRELADGRYKARKEECDRAKAYFGTDNLCDLSLETLEAPLEIPPPLVRRVRHCITEHGRTVKATECLKTQDMVGFGELMNASHQSMCDDFEMSLPEIDRLVETAMAAGALGARLTGGGFGGCMVAAVPAAKVKDWTTDVLERHPSAFLVE
ncbi:MAG: galactokinase [Pseudomonadota bacterium]